MPTYEVRWLTEAEREWDALPDAVRVALKTAVERIQEDPRAHGTYNKRYDQYSATFDYGVIQYAVVDHVLRIIVLRIVGVY
ncbi:type II toxin-antitoxin system RelE family toxin [Saccharopolyspora sp. 5N708]|uniref:type II toxin-antitoxin system RelE family toxin n=1 Tax=Saccharopolyspora sp. 5N708 TaxID=3457424 RepID=UPI003FD150B6